jgi:hypothetical protein
MESHSRTPRAQISGACLRCQQHKNKCDRAIRIPCLNCNRANVVCEVGFQRRKGSTASALRQVIASQADDYRHCLLSLAPHTDQGGLQIIACALNSLGAASVDSPLSMVNRQRPDSLFKTWCGRFEVVQTSYSRHGRHARLELRSPTLLSRCPLGCNRG